MDSYAKAGVNIEKGDALVDWLAKDQGSESFPFQKQIISGIGGFASLFRLKFEDIQKPVLVTCTDGVGTKVKIASQFENFSTVGQDLVAMCVNDLICTGGKPLLFLDYYATGKLDLKHAQEFLQSVRRACEASACALVGGETAEMPGVYTPPDFDCAGFAVGIVDEEKILGPARVQNGDRILGVASNGFHSNGFSLLRKVFADDLEKWRDELLKPTHLYVKLAHDLQTALDIHALAHITGGGVENVPRVLPPGSSWDYEQWQIPVPFLEVQKRTGMKTEELMRVLNCGLGLAVVLSEKDFSQAKAICAKHALETFDLGQVTI